MSEKARKRKNINQYGLRVRLLESRLAEAGSLETMGIQMKPLDRTASPQDRGVDGNQETLKDDVKEVDVDASANNEDIISNSGSVTTDALCNNTTNALSPSNVNNNQFLLLPQSYPFSPSTPKPLRRAISAKNLSEFAQSSPRTFKRVISSSISSPPPICGDSISAINVPVSNEMTQQEKTQVLKRNLSKLLSGIYGVFLLIVGAILYVSDLHGDKIIITEIFSSTIAAIGLIWLIILHVDLYQYKTEVLRQLKEREDAMQYESERFSSATEFIINSGYAIAAEESNGSITASCDKTPPYRFLQGRHSGSFYLKIGMAAFCFGNLIYDGLQLGEHILNLVDDEKKLMNCSRPSSIVVHTILPLHSFYQLFITFKYSNIVINRYKAAARFGLMHLIATCLCFWFNTIIEEAVEDYNQRSNNSTFNETDTEFSIASYHVTVRRKGNWSNPYHCAAESALSTRSMEAIPYLYPFAIEYNLLLAGVWYIVWQNIGQVIHPSDPHHLRHTISQDEGGFEEIAYQSNLVINADCHAANKGLFAGLFLLLTTIVTVIVFFVAMTTHGYQERAVAIHAGQEGILTTFGMVACIVSFIQIKKLDVNSHPITFLDDVLLFVPLPFYFVHGILSVMAEYNHKNFIRLAVHLLVTLQVVVQTPFIIDGLRRCSNSQTLRYKKPGREIITFLIILNLTLWIVNTFELRSVERYHAQEEYFGDFIWMFIGHTTLPLMLFYRFHSSVCLADMWKSAYEKER